MGIQLSLAKSFVQLFDRDFLYPLFKEHGSGHKKYRIYVPLPAKSTEKLEAPKCIVKELLSKNYEVHDYASGLAKHAETKKFCKIGKLLTGKTLQQFANDPARQNAKNAASKNLMMVISRHPYDIAGASYQRGWTSCLDLKKDRNGLKNEVRNHSMIAYLITEDDKEIQNPIGRVLIKKFVNAEDESKFVYVEDHAYGTVHVEFLEYLKKFVNWVNGEITPGVYKVKGTTDKQAFFFQHPLSAEVQKKYRFDISSAIEDYSESIENFKDTPIDTIAAQVIESEQCDEKLARKILKSFDYDFDVGLAYTRRNKTSVVTLRKIVDNQIQLLDYVKSKIYDEKSNVDKAFQSGRLLPVHMCKAKSLAYLKYLMSTYSLNKNYTHSRLRKFFVGGFTGHRFTWYGYTGQRFTRYGFTAQELQVIEPAMKSATVKKFLESAYTVSVDFKIAHGLKKYLLNTFDFEISKVTGKFPQFEINIGTFGTLPTLFLKDVADLLDKNLPTPFDVNTISGVQFTEQQLSLLLQRATYMGRLVRSALKRKPALVYKNVSDEMFKKLPINPNSSLWRNRNAKLSNT